MHLPRKRGRNPVEQDKISAYIRKNIISGKWPIGYKIPPHPELGKKFKVTRVTVQRTLSSLVADGFLRVQMTGVRGTYVNETPPHLYNYALVFPNTQTDCERNLFFSRQLKVSKDIQKELGIKISPYFRLDGNSRQPDYIRLLTDIRKEKLAGIIFASPVFNIENTPIVTEGRIPRVRIGAVNKKLDIPWIALDESSFIEMSLDYLVSENCRKIAFISSHGHLSGSFQQHLCLAFEKRNLPLVPHWQHGCHLGYVEAASNIVRLLMALPVGERPDAIFVGDDNVIGAVCDGLRQVKVKIPEELKIVSHCNFPAASKLPVPVKFIGFNTYAVILKCIELLQLQRESVKTPKENKLASCTEAEYKQFRSAQKMSDLPK